jgi:transposase
LEGNEEMIVIGVDSHKRTHTVVATDETGRRLAEKTVIATSAGHLELVRWATRFTDHRWALEDCRHLSRRLSTDLLRAGEAVVRVPPKLMAGARRSSREPGKSDPIDALAVARAALREDLPAATLDGSEREVRLLVDHREDLVAERTRAQNRLRWHLHELDPGNEPPARGLDRAVVLAALERDLADAPGTVSRIARELVVRIRELTRTINDLEREIGRLVADLAPSLLALTGCGPLTAAKLIGETAGIGRLPLLRRLRPPQRISSAPGLVEQHRTTSSESDWQPPAQRWAPSDFDHPAPARGAGQDVLRASPGDGRHQDRGDPRSPPSDQRRGLSPDAPR